jgi:hypothetical protein
MERCTYSMTFLFPRTESVSISSWRLTPKQDHLVCFLGGSLMLGATRTGTLVHPASVPPQVGELSETGKRDWKTGVELVKTCMDTHDTATYVLCAVYVSFPAFHWYFDVFEGDCRRKLYTSGFLVTVWVGTWWLPQIGILKVLGRS